MTRTEMTPDLDTPAWSAHNLPKPRTSPMLGFSVLAVVAGLVVIVLADMVSGPIRTTGTKMEPARFQSAAQQTGTGSSNIVVAATR